MYQARNTAGQDTAEFNMLTIGQCVAAEPYIEPYIVALCDVVVSLLYSPSSIQRFLLLLILGRTSKD